MSMYYNQQRIKQRAGTYARRTASLCIHYFSSLFFLESTLAIAERANVNSTFQILEPLLFHHQVQRFHHKYRQL